MNIFNKITLKSLLKNRTRTLVTIVGVILSAAMICAVTTSVASLRNFMLQNSIYKQGSWHGQATNADEATLKMIADSDKVKDCVTAEYCGYAKLDESTNAYKPYMYIIGVKNDFKDMMPIHITSGRYPQNPNEILLPEHLESNGGIKNNINDIIELKIGDREIDGEKLYQINPFVYEYESNGVKTEETLKVKYTKKYKVVGFYERPTFEDYTAPGYTALTVQDKKSADAIYDIYFRMNKPKDVYTFMKENELYGTTNSDVLMFLGISRYNGFYTVLYSLAAIITVLIILGSVSLIYNAFSISVSERSRQFGILSSIGATKKQLKKSVLFEAFAISVIGIPIGILAGIFGIGVTLLLIGNKFAAISSTLTVPMKICVSTSSVIIAIVVALLTVLISAWIPSKRATKVSAVEAIRQNNDINNDKKPAKTSKLQYKLFGLPGILASKYFKRSKKKYRTTVISLFMSIVLFVSASAFTEYLTDSVSGGFEAAGYDISLYFSSADSASDDNELYQGLKKVKYVTDSAAVKQTSGRADLSGDIVLKEIRKNLKNNICTVHTSVFFVEDSAYKRLLNDNGLNERDYFNKDVPLGIAYDNQTVFSNEEEKFVSAKILEKKKVPVDITLHTNTDDEPENTVTFKIGYVIDKAPFYINTQNGFTVIYPMSMCNKVLGNDNKTNSMFYFISSDHVKTYAEMKSVLKTYSGSYDLYDYAESIESNRNIVLIVNVFAYGFVALISLIAAANVFNTISTNIALRRREFAMLRSVGMSQKGLNKMMNYECLLYGTKSIILGTPVSLIVSYLLYLAISSGYETGYIFPWKAMLIVVLSVFLVVFATMMYSMRKIKNDNPIDALKNENL